MIVARNLVSYFGRQRLTRDNVGEEAYGGSDLNVVRGGFEALLATDLAPRVRHAIEQARHYHFTVIDCYPDFFASRVNYDVAQGIDSRGAWRSGVLEQSWRMGGASVAEIAALESFCRHPERDRVRASSFEVYGRAEDDQIVPHPVVEHYLAAFKRVRSVTYRVLSGADHALSKQESRQAYGSLLVSWITEMTLGAKATATLTKPVSKSPA